MSSSNFKTLNALVGPEMFARLVRYVAKVNETVIRQRPLIERMCYEVKQRIKFEMGLEGIENGKGVGR